MKILFNVTIYCAFAIRLANNLIDLLKLKRKETPHIMSLSGYYSEKYPKNKNAFQLKVNLTLIDRDKHNLAFERSSPWNDFDLIYDLINSQLINNSS